MSYFLIRVGPGSKYIDEAKKEGFIAVGWDEVAALASFKDVDQIKKALAKTSYNYSPAQIAANAGQLYRFGLEIKNGDTVVSPLGDGQYLVGKARDYYFEDKPHGQCHYRHRRKVDWLERSISKEDMSTNLAYALGSLLTVCSLNKYADEIESLIAGKTFTPAERPQRVRDVILSSLYEMDGREFEEFVQHLLEVIGFKAETTQYAGDKGIDVNGILDAEGLAEVTLRVQVKRVRGSISNKEILALRGTLSQGEHGCFVTVSSFSPQAVQEAQAQGKLTIKLIDGTDLAGLILKHFDELDEKYRALFNIRRKKDFNIEDQFEVAGIEQEMLEVPIKATVTVKDRKVSKPDWDTLVCAAKEDGFKHAFLDNKAWWAVRLNSDFIPFIKYLAMYQVAPTSQITYYGEVDRIEPYQGSEKYKIFLKGEPIKLEKPVGLGDNPHLKPQGPKYAKLSEILKAKTLDDIWG